MATIFRGPVITLKPPQRDPLQARQFVSAGLALLTAVALPVGHAAGLFELPKLPRGDPLQARQLISAGLSRQLAVALPAGHSAGFELADLPRGDPREARQFTSSGLALLTFVALPAGRETGFVDQLAAPPRDPREARNWERNNDLPRQLQVTLPFFQSDWPLADRIALRSPEWQKVNDLSRQTATYPGAQYDWPPPKQVDSPISRRWELANDFPVQLEVLPFNLEAWPLPARTDSPIARDRQRINDLSRQLAITLPAQPYDWPLAKLIPLNPPPLSPINILPVSAQPFAQLDWPLPERTDSPIARDLERSVDLARGEGPFAFSQKDWPLPKLADSPIARDRQRINDLARQLETHPFSQYTWPSPNPPVATAPAFLPPNTAVLTPVIVVTNPFAYFGWTLPLGIDSRQARDWQPITPIPPEPPGGEGPNALRRMLQSDQARDARLRAEGDILALRGMFGPNVVETEAERLQALEKVRLAAIIAEDDDDILPHIGP